MKVRLKREKLSSILDVQMVCECGWKGIVGECEPDVDGDGSLGCPECKKVTKER